MEKRINLEESVYQLTQKYPEIIDIMASLGFTEISKKAIRLSVGKMMTIPKGASMKGIGLDVVVKALESNGFTIEGGGRSLQNDLASRTVSEEKGEQSTERIEHGKLSAEKSDPVTKQIKSYLQRLNQGEDMESVRADFVRHFKSVKATEIMKAEQELIAEGESVKSIKKLCDVHSALFHGSRESVQGDSLHHGLHHGQERMMMEQAGESKDVTARLRSVEGHPLQTFYRENEAVVKALDEVDVRLRNGGDVAEALEKARGLAIHYAKKGDLVYPVLKVKYGIYGPSQVMWTIDDEIRAELSALVRQAAVATELSEDWRARVASVMKRAREMTFKENRILFPVSAANLSDDDWKQMYADAKGYESCLGVEAPRWKDGEEYCLQLRGKGVTTESNSSETCVRMPGGTLSIAQLTAMLDTLPLEITFVDADNINRYFNQPFETKAFKRPLSALGREVFSCHPPKIEPMVRAIIQDFRDGKRDKVPVWLEKNGRTVLVTYMAVRDAAGKYIGTMETVQDMEALKAHLVSGGK